MREKRSRDMFKSVQTIKIDEKKEKLVLLPEERPFYLSVNAARPDLVSGIPLFSHAGNCYCF